MENRLFKNLDYGKKSLLLPILVIIAAILNESFKEFILFEIGEKNAFWFFLSFFVIAILVSLISIFLAILSFVKKQSIIFGIIGFVLDIPILVFYGWLLVLLIILEEIYNSPKFTPRLH